MKRILITGWVLGFNKIGTSKCLRAYLGYDLRDAKDAVDAILQGEIIEFELTDDKTTQLCAELDRLGVICEVVESKNDNYD
jgi:ribosomal protein L7/L12